MPELRGVAESRKAAEEMSRDLARMKRQFQDAREELKAADEKSHVAHADVIIRYCDGLRDLLDTWRRRMDPKHQPPAPPDA